MMTVPNRFVVDSRGVVFPRLYSPEYNSEIGPRYSCAFLIGKSDFVPPEITPFCTESDYVPDDCFILNTSTQFAPVVFGLSQEWLDAVRTHRIPMDRIIAKLKPRASAVIHMTKGGRAGRTFLNLIAVELAMPGKPPTFQDFVDGTY